MTREEFTDVYNLGYSDRMAERDYDPMFHYVDESRTCESCKYAEYHEIQDILECSKLYESQFCYSCNTPTQIHEVTKDFGCNKWKEKQ